MTSSSPGSVPPALSAGTRFGSYEILQRLGAGGMGEVYRARDTRLGREVAIKTVLLNWHSEADSLARLEQEARAACALNHPNIVTIYELGQVDGTHYIAMELVTGETLRDMLSSGPLPFRKTVAIATQIAAALAKAHEIGIVHRDLKPDNIMVASDGVAKVLDFGVAKLLAEERQPSSSLTTRALLTRPGAVLGTVGYMSPEQATGSAVDFRSDQFSFGAVLYEMAAGSPAFQRNTSAETIAAILRDTPERLASKTLQAPAPFVWILERCLAKDPNQRYSSTQDLARDLATLRDRMADAPARQVEPRPNNLPVQRTTLFGRETEASALGELLRREEARLITLTGPGGIGKTRLAVQVAGQVISAFQGGICFVALSAVAESRLIVAAIAQAIGVCEAGTKSVDEALREYICALPHSMLLVLDNFEHLLSGTPTVSDLLSFGPKLKVMVTSQSPLHVYGEHEFPVAPLALPDSKSMQSVETLSRLPAIALFTERAQAVKRDFVLTRDNATAVAAICARLDGLPLAIELAAARIKLLSPSAMQARLESCLNLLTGGARDLPTRQQTLRGTVDWSYGLLNYAEQRLFRRLSVFVGGCTLEGAEAVCDTVGDLGLDVLDGMASMLDKSLVQQAEHADSEGRFSMLSTIREYALERLAQSGEEAATRRSHAAYCLVLAEEGTQDAAAQSQWMDRFELEHDNFRTALDHLIKTDAEWAMRLGAALFRFWETREHLSEGREWITKLLNLQGSDSHPKLRARLLFAAAVLSGEQGDYNAAQVLFENSMDACRALGDNRGVAVALNALAVNARDRGEYDLAASLFEQCVSIWKDLGDPADMARALSNLANVAKSRGDHHRAFLLYDECLALFRKVGDLAGVAWTLNYQGDVAREKSDLDTARSLYEQSLSAFDLLRDGWGIASVLSDLATLSREQGDFADARRLYGESLKMFRDLGHKRGIARVFECLATSAVAQFRAEHALRMAGAAASLRQLLGAPLTTAEQARLDQALEGARQALSSVEGPAAWMKGWTMPLEQAIDEALEQQTL